jgi:hypothetical protein
MTARAFLVAALAAGCCVALAPVAAAWVDPTTDPVAGTPKAPRFDARAPLSEDGRTATLAGPLACTSDEGKMRVTIRVTLAQRSSRAAGETLWRGSCAKPRWKAAVTSERPFRPGSARACALGVQRSPDGTVHDVLSWCDTVRLIG